MIKPFGSAYGSRDRGLRWLLTTDSFPQSAEAPIYRPHRWLQETHGRAYHNRGTFWGHHEHLGIINNPVILMSAPQSMQNIPPKATFLSRGYMFDLSMGRLSSIPCSKPYIDPIAAFKGTHSMKRLGTDPKPLNLSRSMSARNLRIRTGLARNWHPGFLNI